MSDGSEVPIMKRLTFPREYASNWCDWSVSEINKSVSDAFIDLIFIIRVYMQCWAAEYRISKWRQTLKMPIGNEEMTKFQINEINFI